MIALDTNLLVRLLTNDDPRQAAKVEAWLRDNATPKTPAYVDHVVLCELGWVLERSYGYERAEVHAALAALLEQDHLKVESPGLVRQALMMYADGPADFSDYLLAVRAQAAGYSPVLTLDKKAAKAATHQLLR
ncbi:MAG: type II toxin-antitoxin system VapC family toxin [Polaromonas sp.]|uniref:PIN domain-containing protein n=1 Tax=Polaromonas sp. TaxID=1869339 RepID=UPI00273341F7|nr:type II toxin-antitoxin system VapC family toxin [Polaromonas sp.]MDP3798566.1 type II toxin-antitoxin system VapC family toxin [Polaromonas sp.]